MSGTYTIGGSGSNYASIESAIAALQSAGVSGAVTFQISSGTYSPPAQGYRLPAVTGMSATNTVTFKPAASATVVISGSTNQGCAIFTINGGKYYIIDGSNSSGGTTRNMTIRQTEPYYNPTILLRNDADLNVIKNCVLQGNAQYTYPGFYIYESSSSPSVYNSSAIVVIGNASTTSGTSPGNDSNLVQNNLIGDPTGTYRQNMAVLVTGYNALGTYAVDYGNRIEGNDVVNFGKSTDSYTGYGITSYYYSAGTVIKNNEIHLTQPAPYYQVYGIYLYETSSSGGNHVVDGNRIYRLSATPTYGYEYLYHIYSYLPISNTTTFKNNMISMTESGPAYIYGLYLGGSGTYNVDNNSFYAGGVGDSYYSMYMFYRSGSFTTNHRNNIYYSTRTGGSATNVGVYSSSTTGWTSNNNLFNVNTASNYYTAYLSGYRTTLANLQSAGAQDAASVGGIPQFIDADNGNLHISTTRRTPVEGRGTPLSSVTTDIDGNTRSTTAPDIGADEGTFMSVLSDDMAADRFINPLSGRTVRAGTSFTPSGMVYNTGTNVRTSVGIRFRIWSGTTVVYNDLQTISSLNGLTTQQVAFNQSGNVTGSTALQPGIYTIEMRAEFASDQDTANNAIYGTINVKAPMSGTYTINRSGTGIRNYTSFTAAIQDIGALGVSTSPTDSAVTFLISSGTYDGSTETFPLVLNQAAGMTSTKTVTFKPAPSATVAVVEASGGPLFDINTGDYYILDGSNSANGTSRNWRIVNAGSGPSVRFINGATYNVVKNMHVASNNPSYSYYNSGNNGNVVFGLSSSTYGVGNSYNSLTNNLIGDSTGTIRAGMQVFSYGDYSYPNTANLIQGNDILNFGNNNSGYGVVMSYYNDRVKIYGNKIHNTSTSNTANGYSMYGVYYYNTYGNYDSIAYNQIYDLISGYPYGVGQYAITVYYQNYLNTTVVHNNSIDIGGSNSYCYPVYVYGYNTATCNIEHNTINMTGTPSSAYGIYNAYSSVSLVIRNNILSDSRTTPGSNDYLIYVPSLSGTLTSNNNVFYLNNGGYIGYWNSTYSTLSAWQSTGMDANSVYGSVPFVDVANHNLHIDPQPVFKGEGMGANAGYTYDMDMQTREVATPDIGADEGDFNGGGITLSYPNGGEQITVDYLLTVQYATTRPMGVRIELSTDNGNTWTQYGSVSPTARGNNSFTFTTPDVVTNQARVRVISMKNRWEADTSNATFNLVRPIVTLLKPNGGERLIGSDTTAITWNSQYIPPSTKVQVDYSLDGGATWVSIATNVTSNNLPATNSLSWIIPSMTSQNALMRVKLMGSSINDVSDAVFTILPTPNVDLLTPNGGEKWFVGETSRITWTSISTDYVTLDYSTDGGTSWSEIAHRVPAYLGGFDWTVPNTVSTNALVRLTNVERPRFVDRTSAPFSILKAAITVTGPNGGEKVELNQPVNVTWNSENSSRVRIEFSGNGGTTWSRVAAGLPASLGTFQFVPSATPTKSALVRVVDEDRPAINDASDAPFEILEPKSIVVFTPATGDEIPRGSMTQVTWTAPRVESVNILYSSNGGGTWTSIASNVPSSQGTFNWIVPSVNTTQGKVRVAEVGGTLVAETGLFSIIDPKNPFIQVLSPNGGEKYNVGADITINWTSANISDRLAVSYSTDGGTSWKVIQSNIMPITTQLVWKAPTTTGDQYRIKVSSAAANDQSDANFSISRDLAPKITLVYPNGGESLRADTTVAVTWTEQDITGSGSVDVTYSTDGTTWKPIASVPAGTGTVSWKVPNEPSSSVMVQVSATGQASDRSDATFNILPRLVMPITVLTPNGGETLESGAPFTITFSAPSDVVNVWVFFSRDGGQNWEAVAGPIPAASGSYPWITPTMPTTTTTSLIRIADAADQNRKDESDAPFTIKAAVTSAVGMEDAVAGARGISLIGNFPNPFASSTEIRWAQGVGGETTLRMFRDNGAMVRTVQLGNLEPGQQRYEFLAGDLASGLYHYELRVGGTIARGTMLIAR